MSPGSCSPRNGASFLARQTVPRALSLWSSLYLPSRHHPEIAMGVVSVSFVRSRMSAYGTKADKIGRALDVS